MTTGRSSGFLIVDDDRSNSRLLGMTLEALGYAVDTAENGAQACALFERQRPAIVLMDLQMPVMDGYEATRRIKKSCGEDFVPVIFLTGETDELALCRCL